MKFRLLVIAGLCGTLCAVPLVEQRNLQDDLQDFLDLIPFNQIRKTVQEYLDHDMEVQEAFDYLKSDEFAAAWKYTVEHPDILEIMHNLQQSGLDMVSLLNKIADLLGLQQLHPKEFSYADDEIMRSTGGVKSLVQEVIDLLPLSDFMILFFDKMDSSEDFQRLMERIQSTDFQKIVDFVESSPAMLAILNKLQNLGFDVQTIVDYVKSFFGW